MKRNIGNLDNDYRDDEHHLAEPVYPKEFIPFLFSLVDWNELDRLSMLYLITNTSKCNVIRFTLQLEDKNGYHLLMTYPIGDSAIELRVKDGRPVEFMSSDGKFIRMQLQNIIKP
jgi:hypothetical protein